MSRQLPSLVILALAALMAWSCRDACRDTVCEHGECDDGECVCEPGYGGSDCSVLLRDSFLGEYMARETCGTLVDSYLVSLKPGVRPDEILVHNFAHSGQDVTARTAESGGIYFLPAFSTVNGLFITGYAIPGPSGSDLRLEYMATTIADTLYSCSAILRPE